MNNRRLLLDSAAELTAQLQSKKNFKKFQELVNPELNYNESKSLSTYYIYILLVKTRTIFSLIYLFH